MRYFKRTLVVFISTALCFLFSYLFHFVLGRLLGPEEYGLFGVALNMVWIVGIPGVAITTSLVKYASEFKALKEFGKLKSLFLSFICFQLIFNLGFMLFFIGFRFFLSESLGGGLADLLIAAAISLPFAGIASIVLNYLQGIQRIYSFSLVNASSTLFKLIIGTLLVLAGFGAFGALTSLIFSSIGVIILGFVFIIPDLRVKVERINYSRILKFGLPVLFTNLFINLILYFDLFFVKVYLGAASAGYYEAAVVLSRAFLMSSAVLAVFFPEFAKNKALKNLKKLRSNLKWALFYTSGICVVGLFAYFLFPSFIIELTYSSEFLPAVPLLMVLAVGYTFYSLFNVVLFALWSLEEHKIVGMFGLTLFIFDLVLLSFFVPTIGAIAAAWITTILMIVLFVFSCLLVFVKILRK